MCGNPHYITLQEAGNFGTVRLSLLSLVPQLAPEALLWALFYVTWRDIGARPIYGQSHDQKPV